jgi:hypothetical protein
MSRILQFPDGVIHVLINIRMNEKFMNFTTLLTHRAFYDFNSSSSRISWTMTIVKKNCDFL